MVSLWGFFGLPDPDGVQKPSQTNVKPVESQPDVEENNLTQSTLDTEQTESSKEPLTDLPKLPPITHQSHHRKIGKGPLLQMVSLFMTWVCKLKFVVHSQQER